jgi:hypothetical protein
MCEITALGDFRGLWEGWETDSFIVGLPCFPSGRHFHRVHRGRPLDFRCVIWPVDAARVLLVSVLGAVGQDLRQVLRVLLGLDCSECVSQPLVLYDGRMVDTLILAEDPVGKQLTLPSHLERPICKVIDLNVLTC